MSSDSDLTTKTRSAGQPLFVAGCLVLTVLLLLQIRGQTVWTENARNFAAQPRLWPAIALVLMAACFGLHLWHTRRRPRARDWAEVRRWLEPAEFALWFMAYVFVVPILGFLPMSIALAVALAWRLGYRQRGMLVLAAGFAVTTVLLFKGFLGVNIPGAALYQLLPDGLRSFFLIYL